MSYAKSFPKMLILSVAAMLILGALAIVVVDQANRSRSEIPVWGEVSDFEFTAAHNGEPFGLEQMKGKLNVVDFIFTNCKSICPIMAENMVDLYDLYSGSDLVQFVSISVDPVRDTLETLNEYARQQGVNDNRWVFLRASIEDVVKICEGDFMLAADQLPMGHTSKFILVDQFGQIRSYHDGTESGHMVSLKNNIRQLAKEM
ncbi:MAG: SCO family protein [candidate division Zixibacteria bacterium]|nr:SCO family protein [candidate division Zixibacteria bacterium]